LFIIFAKVLILFQLEMVSGLN